MTQISPLKSEAVQTQFSSIGTNIRLAQSDYHSSSLRSANLKKKSVVGWISNYFNCNWSLFTRLFFCFKNSGEIDWEQTRVIFTGIEKAVLSSDHDQKLGQKNFKTHFEELSAPARTLFERHIGYGIARCNGNSKKEDQEKYVNQHWTEISKSIQTALDDISRTELREAVSSFKREIERQQIQKKERIYGKQNF